MRPLPLPVLLIEDDPGQALLIQELLAEDDRFEIVPAGSLLDGMLAVGERPWAAVLLDLSLPDSSGLETLRRFREHCAAPVVVLTGYDDSAAALEALRHGAQDYLVKGQAATDHLIHALHYAISRHQWLGAMVVEHPSNEEELRIARQIQQRLFPDRMPGLAGFEIHAMCRPAVETGGDFFDYLPLAGGSWGLVVGDVTGHGVGPALLMATTRAYFRAFASMGMGIDAMMGQANRLLAADVGERCVPLVLVQIDPAGRLMHYLNAGHRPGYVLDRFGEVKARLGSTDTALGIFPEGRFRPPAPIALHAGDLLLVATDGVHEAHGDTGLFSEERMLAAARRHAQAGPAELVERLYMEVRAHEGERRQHDDITILAARVL